MLYIKQGDVYLQAAHGVWNGGYDGEFLFGEASSFVKAKEVVGWECVLFMFFFRFN